MFYTFDYKSKKVFEAGIINPSTKHFQNIEMRVYQ
jgi:hypothetical protein